MGFGSFFKEVGNVAKWASGVGFVDEAFFAGARRAERHQKDAQALQEEQAEVAEGRAEAERQQALRQNFRKERLRRAQVLSAAESSGVTGGSAPTSTIGAGQTIAAAGSAFSSGQNLAYGKMGDLGQQAANSGAKARDALATGQMWQSAFNLGTTAVGAL